MKFKLLTIFSIFLFFLTDLANQITDNTSNIEESSIFTEPTMCTELVGRCTGSAYCTACTNCSRCGYCNSGGSCGVCRKRVKTYRPRKKKKTTLSNQYNIKKSTPSSDNQPNHLTETIYVLTQKTSLRESADASAKVLRRLAINDRVQMLDSYTQKYWCKVLHKGKIGWVKKHLLEKRKTAAYP